jgi:hypothetical protein
MRNEHKIFLVNPEGKSLLERPTHEWENNIRMDLRKTGLKGAVWIHLAQNTG